jgi:ribosomal protein S18 acetylase RimI-like enzyme
VTVTLRDAGIADRDDLQRIFRSASLSNRNDWELLREHPEWLELPTDDLAAGRTRVAVDDGGTVVGFASYAVVEGVAELTDLFVDPGSMRRGVGTALVEDLVARLGFLGYGALEVTANPHALAFYERTGFVEVGAAATAGYAAPRMRRSTAPTDPTTR